MLSFNHTLTKWQTIATKLREAIQLLQPSPHEGDHRRHLCEILDSTAKAYEQCHGDISKTAVSLGTITVTRYVFETENSRQYLYGYENQHTAPEEMWATIAQQAGLLQDGAVRTEFEVLIVRKG